MGEVDVGRKYRNGSDVTRLGVVCYIHVNGVGRREWRMGGRNQCFCEESLSVWNMWSPRG